MSSGGEEALDRKHSALRQAMGPVLAAALPYLAQARVLPELQVGVEVVGEQADVQVLFRQVHSQIKSGHQVPAVAPPSTVMIEPVT